MGHPLMKKGNENRAPGHIDFHMVQPPEKPAVPRLPTSFLAVAGSGMGKTTAILAALLDKRLYRVSTSSRVPF